MSHDGCMAAPSARMSDEGSARVSAGWAPRVNRDAIGVVRSPPQAFVLAQELTYGGALRGVGTALIMAAEPSGAPDPDSA